MFLYNKTINYSVEQTGGDLRVQTTMIDHVHEMVLELTIGLEDNVIRKVRFEMIRAPHGLVCREMEKKARTMEGCVAGRGISGVIKARLGGAEGCQHLTEMFYGAVKAFKHGQYRLIYLTEKDREKRQDIYWNQLKGTCFYYTHGREEKYREQGKNQQ